MKMACYLPTHEPLRNPTNTMRNVNQAKCLDTKERDVGSHVDSKVHEILNCVKTAMQSTIRTT